ncbi:hypothetical protein [Wukongibacter baidiensis]
MTKAIYQGRSYTGILNGSKISLVINGQITQVPISKCEKVYSIKFILEQNDEDVEVLIEELSKDDKIISIYAYNPNFWRSDYLSCLGKFECAGDRTIQDHDMFRMLRTDEKIKKKTETILTYPEFVEVYNKEVREL